MFNNHNSCFCKYIPKAGILFPLQNKQTKKPPTDHSISLNHCAFQNLMLFHLIFLFFYFFLLSIWVFGSMAECWFFFFFINLSIWLYGRKLLKGYFLVWLCHLSIWVVEVDKMNLIINDVGHSIFFWRLYLSSYDWTQSYKGLLGFNEKFSTLKQKCI